MEYTSNMEHTSDIECDTYLKPPPLTRQITNWKWECSKHLYEENINTATDDNYVDENGVYFFLVNAFYVDNDNGIHTTKHYLIKIDDHFFEIIFEFNHIQENPEIKNVSFEEFNSSILINETNEDDTKVLTEKVIVNHLLNNKDYYFIVKYKYRVNERCPVCIIKQNL